MSRSDLSEHHVLDHATPFCCKFSLKSPARILKHHLWNSLVNKAILACIPHYGWILCRSWRSQWVVSDRQHDPPHLVLWSRVKVRTKVLWHLLDRTSCTKVIPYLAFACELECVYHDVCNCWRTEWTWPQVPSCHVAKLGGFFSRIFTKKVFMVLLSFIGLSKSLMCISLPMLTCTLPYCHGWHMWSLVGKVERHLLDSNLLQDQRLDP